MINKRLNLGNNMDKEERLHILAMPNMAARIQHTHLNHHIKMHNTVLLHLLGNMVLPHRQGSMPLLPNSNMVLLHNNSNMAPLHNSSNMAPLHNSNNTDLHSRHNSMDSRRSSNMVHHHSKDINRNMAVALLNTALHQTNTPLLQIKLINLLKGNILTLQDTSTEVLHHHHRGMLLHLGMSITNTVDLRPNHRDISYQAQDNHIKFLGSSHILQLVARHSSNSRLGVSHKADLVHIRPGTVNAYENHRL